MACDGLTQSYELADKKIWVAGHNGMVGRSLLRSLDVYTDQIITVARKELDLTNTAQTELWIDANKPDVIILAAAKVGGILANDTYPADFLYQNLMIQNNVIHGAYKFGVQKLLFLGSSCIYPKEAKNPIIEDSFMTGPLEKTNEAYAIAKIAGIKMCQAYRKQYGCDFISAMPCNLYGPGDMFDAQTSHVIPALMLKAHRAKQEHANFLEIWGSGKPRREFLYVDDLARGLVQVLQSYSSAKPINIGAGTDISIHELANTVCEVVGFRGELKFDNTKPDGTFQKLIDSSRIMNAGWSPRVDLRSGLALTYKWFLDNQRTLRDAA